YHQIGSLAVLLNSMRLLWFERSTTNPGWVRWQHGLRDFDRWLGRNLDLHELSHRAERHAWGLAMAVVFLLLAGYALTGLTTVGPDEFAVVRRFGKPVDDLGPGWHWRYPWPIEEVARVSQQVRIVTLGFREAPEPTGKAAALTWSSQHRR